jgi:hypothetical protein
MNAKGIEKLLEDKKKVIVFGKIYDPFEKVTNTVVEEFTPKNFSDYVSYLNKDHLQVCYIGNEDKMIIQPMETFLRSERFLHDFICFDELLTDKENEA